MHVVRPGLSLGLHLVAGLLGGAVAVVVHQRWWGLLLLWVAVVATVVALRPGWVTRLPFAVGFVAVLGLGMVQRGEGDYLIPANGRGYALLALAFVLFLLAVATLPKPVRSLDSAP